MNCNERLTWDESSLEMKYVLSYAGGKAQIVKDVTILDKTILSDIKWYEFGIRERNLKNNSEIFKVLERNTSPDVYTIKSLDW